jgi:hypothetical protein
MLQKLLEGEEFTLKHARARAAAKLQLNVEEWSDKYKHIEYPGILNNNCSDSDSEDDEDHEAENDEQEAEAEADNEDELSDQRNENAEEKEEEMEYEYAQSNQQSHPYHESGQDVPLPT